MTLTIEKPAVGGRMIARADGQVVLVDGALPGEVVSAEIERVAKGVVYARTLAVEEPSPDRREPFTDRSCGGCSYAHIAYPRQLEIKSLVIADALARIGHVTVPEPVRVAASPPEGYRMRARLHRRGGELGFFREGTHELCDARATRQLLSESCDVLDALGAALAEVRDEGVHEVELSENVEASERVVHLQASSEARRPWSSLPAVAGVTGVTVSNSAPGTVTLVAGSAYLSDKLQVGEQTLTLRRHGLAFFQGNRFLVRDLVSRVLECIPQSSTMLDLYAGGGMFSVAAAASRRVRVTAVEGDRLAGDDLAVNARAAGGAVVPVFESVEAFLRSGGMSADVVLVDPPRTGMSPDALEGVVRARGGRLVYVSCDVATLARDARRLVDSGFGVTHIVAFDLFPNTPHVETVVVFDRR